MNCEFLIMNFDDLVKSRKSHFYVIPMKMGIQYFSLVARLWIPASAGMTVFYESINFELDGQRI